MQDFDLFDGEKEPVKGLDRLIKDLNGIEKLWRLTDDNQANYFTLVLRNGQLEECISLMDLLKEFIDLNKEVNIFDLFFCYMVRIKKKRKLTRKDHFSEMLNYNSMYLATNLLINRARSSYDFHDKIEYIRVSPGQEEKPFSHHWDLKYTDPNHDKDPDLIRLLMGCCIKNEIPCNEQYLNYIFDLDLKYEKTSEISAV